MKDVVVMEYYSSSPRDYSVMPLRQLIIRLVNFREVHKNHLQREAKLHGATLK